MSCNFCCTFFPHFSLCGTSCLNFEVLKCMICPSCNSQSHVFSVFSSAVEREQLPWLRAPISSLSLQSLCLSAKCQGSDSFFLSLSLSLSLPILQYAVLGQEAGAGDWWSDEDIWWSPAAPRGKLSVFYLCCLPCGHECSHLRKSPVWTL